VDQPVSQSEQAASARKRLGDELKRRRKQARLKQRELGGLIGYAREYVTMAEGQGAIPSEKFFQRAGEVVGGTGRLLQLRDQAVAEREAERQRRTPAPAKSPPDPAIADAGFPEIDDMNRRELLRLFSMIGTLLAMAPFDGDLDWERLGYLWNRTSRLDSATVDEYAALNTHLWRVFTLSRSKSLTFPLVREQLDVLADALQQSSEEALYRRVCQLASDLFQLAGEILFDCNQYSDAAQCYALAAMAGKEGNAPDLWACALTRYAFIDVYERQFDKAAAMLELAARLARLGDGTLSTRYWVAVVQAEAFAGLGKFDDCQRALGIAEQVHQLQGQIHNGGWLRFDGSRLAEERGTCYIQLRRPDLAEAALTDALRQDLSVRRRGSVLTDLAVLGAQRRDLDHLVTHADAALELARQTGSGVLGRKLQGLQPHLAPFLGDSRVRDLSKKIATLTRTFAA